MGKTTKALDGAFILKGLYPRAGYNLSFEGGQSTDLTSAPEGETTMLRGSVVLKFSPFKKGSDGVVTDPRTGLEWARRLTLTRQWTGIRQNSMLRPFPLLVADGGSRHGQNLESFTTPVKLPVGAMSC